MDRVLSLFGLKTTGIVGSLTLSKTGTTARTATFPDAAITVAGSASALTPGRVTYVATGGLLADSTGLTFAVTGGGRLTVGDGSGSAYIAVDSLAANASSYRYLKSGVLRWVCNADGTPNWVVDAYTSGGAYQDTPLTITNAAGGAITLARPVTCTGTVTVPNGTAAAPGIRTTTHAHGLHSIGATSIGVDVAGALVLTVGSTASSLAAGSIFTFSNTTDATTTSDGSVRLSGGLSVAKSCIVAGSAGQFINIANSTGELRVNGTKVVGAQGSAVADASGGATVDAEARTAINTLLARLRTHGLIAT
jgi:hypothetical protein